MNPSHFAALMHELAAHGETTYDALLARYDDPMQYSYDGFVHAVHKARRLGLVRREGRSTIIASGCCPTCGRALGEER